MNEFWKFLSSTFSNRQLAVGVWLTIIFFACLLHSQTRKSLWSVGEALFQWKLFIFFGSLATYVALFCWLFQNLGLWTTDQLPATIIWFFLSGSALLVRALSVKEDEGYFAKIVKDNVRVGFFFEFIIVAYSFSIFIELVLIIPILFLIGGMLVIAQTEKKYAQVGTFLNLCFALFVIVLLWWSVSGIWSNWDEFVTMSTGRNFILPIILTICSVPCFYIWYCYSHIETARIQIDRKTFQSDDLKRYARKRFFLIFMARPWLLRRAVRQFHSQPARANEDVDQIVKDICRYEREAAAPPEVDPALGWSPYLARDFLSGFGLRTADYRRGYDGEWWAGSEYIDLDDQIVPNKVTYYIAGTDKAVTTLKLTGIFMDKFVDAAAMVRLREVAELLLERANANAPVSLTELIPGTEPFNVKLEHSGTKIQAWLKRYPSGKGFEIFLILSR